MSEDTFSIDVEAAYERLQGLRDGSWVPEKPQSNPNRTHGRSGTPTYIAWVSMLSRCKNPKASSYEHYGGRGIAVCERWREEDGFVRFLQDMGERPAWATGGIDRIDNEGNYEPANCRWSTRSEQNRNRRKGPASCTEDGCEEKPVARGLCSKHYHRWKRARLAP